MHDFNRPVQLGYGASNSFDAVPMNGVKNLIIPSVVFQIVRADLRSTASKMYLVVVVGRNPSVPHAQHGLGSGVR
jgi:hypothetical protein